MDVVFCFDCEGTPAQIRAVRDVADARNVPLTFFFVGDTARENTALVRECAVLHEVHTHSEKHLRHRGLPKEEQRALIRAGRERVEDILGKPVAGFRAPYHAIDRASVEILNEERFLFDASALYYRYDMKDVHELTPSWFREWAPWYPRIGLSPARAFSVFRLLARRRDPLVVPLHPHYTGAAKENCDALGGLMDWLKRQNANFIGAEAHVRARLGASG